MRREESKKKRKEGEQGALRECQGRRGKRKKKKNERKKEKGRERERGGHLSHCGWLGEDYVISS